MFDSHNSFFTNQNDKVLIRSVCDCDCLDHGHLLRPFLKMIISLYFFSLPTENTQIEFPTFGMVMCLLCLNWLICFFPFRSSSLNVVVYAITIICCARLIERYTYRSCAASETPSKMFVRNTDEQMIQCQSVGNLSEKTNTIQTKLLANTLDEKTEKKMIFFRRSSLDCVY